VLKEEDKGGVHAEVQILSYLLETYDKNQGKISEDKETEQKQDIILVFKALLFELSLHDRGSK